MSTGATAYTIVRDDYSSLDLPLGNEVTLTVGDTITGNPRFKACLSEEAIAEEMGRRLP